MALAKILGGILLGTLALVFSLTRVAFEILGASTSPDDFILLKQRMPTVMNWLVTTPWQVPTLLLVLIAVASAFLLWSGTRAATSATIDGHAVLTVDRVQQLIREAKIEEQEAANSQMSLLQAEIRRLQSQADGQKDILRIVAASLGAPRPIAALTEVLREVEGIRELPAGTPVRPEWEGTLSPERGLSTRIRGLLSDDQWSDLAAKIESDRSRILGDAKYLIMTREEKSLFDGADQKREYYLRLARMKAYEEALVSARAEAQRRLDAGTTIEI